MAVQLLSVSDYARHRGCDEKAVRKAIAENRITAITDANGKRRIDPDVADIQWAKNTRARADSSRSVAAPAVVASAAPGSGFMAPTESVAPDQAPNGGSEYKDRRSQVEAETLRKARRDNDLAEGLLVERKRFDRGAFDAFKMLRDRAFTVSQRAAPRCIGLSDARDIERVIDEEQRRAFSDWDSDIERLLPHPDGYPPEEIPN